MPSMYEGTPSGSPLEPSFPELRRPASTPSSRSRPSTPSTRPDTPSTLTPLINGLNVRLASRNGELLNHTSGLAPSCLQANLIILPSKYAEDFRLLCKRNPVPCPLLAESESAGRYDALKSYIPGLAGKGIADDVDIRRDCPKFMVYRAGKLIKQQIPHIVKYWTDDHVAFLLGCSFSFETALLNSNLIPRHISMRRNVPMYRTNIPLCPAGVFTGGTYVVSMRPYKWKDIERVRQITREFTLTHGEPIDWGWGALRRLGIKNIDIPDWGDVPSDEKGILFSFSQRLTIGEHENHNDEDEVPVFWGCGVTPQEAVTKANLEGIIMAHAPGHMLVLDCHDVSILDGGRPKSGEFGEKKKINRILRAPGD